MWLGHDEPGARGGLGPDCVGLVGDGEDTSFHSSQDREPSEVLAKGVT